MNVIKTYEPKNIPKLYSADLNKLIKKMLVKDPKKRPTSRDLLQDPILVQLMINYSSQVNLK
jgi:serine/threonine protein kinase